MNQLETNQTCVLCRVRREPVNPTNRDLLAGALAEEIQWERHPVEVSERKCPECRNTFRWWWFLSEPIHRPNGKRVRWDAQTLSTVELEQILMDCLSDLWADSYRRDDRGGQLQLRIFSRKVETAMWCATGKDLKVSRSQERG